MGVYRKTKGEEGGWKGEVGVGVGVSQIKLTRNGRSELPSGASFWNNVRRFV